MVQKIFVIAAPSGTGKTTIAQRILAQYPEFVFSISATTRPPRGVEKDGVDYHFKDVLTFKQLIEDDAFLEWEMVYEGKYYGTLKSEIDRIYAKNQYPLLDIDVVGAVNLKKKFGNQVFTIFIKPPSIEVLEERLRERNTDTLEMIEERIDKAAYELSFENEFDAVVVNANLDTAVTDFINVLKKELPDL